MTARAQERGAPPSVGWRALVVLGLLAGLLGMHALAPGGGMETHSAARHTTTVAGPHGGCSGDDCGGGHLKHADQTCASAAVSGGPTLPALAPDPVTVPARADIPCPYAGTAPDGARAPPSLAELQLLRI
ncbi:DUF6153 family protein [Streptomyces gilvus]|uniref:DUF6153 family protein n=1 Tax=Streptomyces gilvus TaxID=2920937 RepID=UPI001F10FB34|nr:DUF6153 family protein [Streptomyces sp. CME 23]MCH5672207.1 DUF6153 family protein [Streptomyces sp. CME 23]